MDVSKHDWELFRSRLGEWQERHMESLLREYDKIANGEGNASDRFWKLYNRINEDRNSPGVVARVSRSYMLPNIVGLSRQGVITMDDLKDFSPELQEYVQRALKW